MKKYTILATVILIIVLVLGAYFLIRKETLTDTLNERLIILDKEDQEITLDDLSPLTSDRDRYISELLKQKSIPEGFYKFGKSDLRGNLFLTKGFPGDEFIILFQAINQKTEKILWELESKLIFNLPLKTTELIDLNNDGYLDIYVHTLAANYLEIERPWFFIYSNGDYRLATPLSNNTDPEKALSGEESALNMMEVRMPIGANTIWLRDLDEDKIYEIITLDQGHFSKKNEVILEFTKRIYKLQNHVYILQSETQISVDSEEYKELKNWEPILGLKNKLGQ